MKPRAFRALTELRAWLVRNHAREKELFIRCYKNHAKHKGVTYFQAVDEALCFGWIDGVRRPIDQDTFNVRFTPRKPKSIWSAVNIKRARGLEADGRMHPSGLAAFRAREKSRMMRYSFESKPLDLDAAYARKLRKNRRAWTFFHARSAESRLGR